MNYPEVADSTPPLTVVGEQGRFPRVELVEPSTSGYVLLAAEVDRRLPFLPNSRRKQRLIRRSKELCRRLESDERVASAVVFDAVLIPPGRGEFLKESAGKVHVARFDLAILIETTSPESAREIQALPAYRELAMAVERASRFSIAIRARNVKRIGPVDHDSDGVFLFNYFFADNTQQNLAVWEYTAGWFQDQTGLDNSTVLLPEAGERSDYKIINHCRWDRLRDVLPSLLFKRSFRTYVLANFHANRVAAMPILYRRA